MMSYTMARRREFFDLRKMLELTKELELAGIDFVRLHGVPAKELRRMTDDMGIPVVCHTFFADLGNPDAAARQQGVDTARRSLDDAVALGAPMVMIPTPGANDTARAVARQYWIDGLSHLVPHAQAAGVTPTVENFPGAASPFVIADDLLEAVRAVPGLKVTYDNGNAATGEDPVESFRRCARHVVHVHFKDWTVSDTDLGAPYRRMLDGRYYKPALIGEGFVNQAACLAALKDAGYDGAINIEYEGNDYRPDQAVRKALDTLRALDRE